MQPIELLACMGCQRVVDQFTFPIKCPRCMGRFHKQIAPTKWNVLRWALTHPAHVMKLYIKDIRENYHDKSRS